MTTDTRFSFDQDGQAILPGTYEATPIEMAAQFMVADNSRIHRRSYDMAAPECRIDRNEATRILVRAYVMERESYRCRAKGQHRGVLGDLGIDLLEALINLALKYGQIYPKLETLARMVRKDVSTLIEAMKRLINRGFVTKHRRSKLVTTAEGHQRRRQDSNAYEVHMPDTGLAIVPLVTAKASDLDNSNVSSLTAADLQKQAGPADEKDRFWLPEPYRMADGSWQ